MIGRVAALESSHEGTYKEKTLCKFYVYVMIV